MSSENRASRKSDRHYGEPCEQGQPARFSVPAQLDLELQAAPRRRRSAALRSFHISQPGGHASVGEALEGEQKAQRQEQEVLAFFRERDRLAVELCESVPRWTPSEVHLWDRRFHKYPLTSIRRAISDLTKRGLLRHHKLDRRPGPYGSKESTWSLA